MSAAYDEEAVTISDEEEVPFQIEEEIDIGDLSDQQGGVLERATRVHSEIKKASVRITKDKQSGVWMVKRLALDVVVGPLGTDGEGTNAGRHLFPDFILVFNKKDFPQKYESDWWKHKSRYPTKEFFKALDLPLDSKINDDFLAALIGRWFTHDIKKKNRQEKINDKYVNVEGEYENELLNFRSYSGE